MKVKYTIAALAVTTIAVNAAVTATKDASAFAQHHLGNEIWDGTAYANGWDGAGASGGTTADYSLNGINAGVSADHFLIRPTLSASSVTGTLFFQSPTPDAANGVTGTLPYATWKSVFGVRSDNEDPDHDGLSAMMEFNTGGLPGVPAGDYPSVVPVEDGGIVYLGFRFRIANGLAGLSYSLEGSENLQSFPGWLEEVDAVLVSSEDNGEGSNTVIWRLPDPVTDFDRKFVRARFEYSE